MPLGDAYLGQCCADSGCRIEPDISVLRDLCNIGYARGRCPRFPDSEGPDAVRFTVVRDSGGVIRIWWVREKDHRPVDHGPLDYSVADAAFIRTEDCGAVRQQAHAYVSAYLRRKTRIRKA